MRKIRKINYGGMLLGKEEKAAIKKAIDKNYWPSGEEVLAMEKEAAQYLGIKYGVLANSGSSAGLLALTALELPKGSEVIIPATTFPTIFNIILQCGLVPVVVDCKPGTYTVDIDKLETAISSKTKAVICVHAVGNACDMPRIMKIANRHKLIVIEDNCDGWGGAIGKKKLGTFGHVSFTSFHAAHIVSMGQGGGVFTNNKELARKVKMYRDWGRQSNLTKRINNRSWPTLPKDYDARFIYEKIGYNLGPLDPQAAMGRVQLKRTEKIKALRKKNFDYLYKHLSQFPDLLMPEWVQDSNPSWFSFPLSYKNRGALVDHLEKNGIETRSMFSGDITKHPAYRNTTYRRGSDLKGCQKILKESFWISVHPRLTQDDREYIIDVFHDFFKTKTS